MASGQNRPERNPAERPGRDVLARRANRDAGRNAAVRPHGRMRDGPKGRSPLRHAKPSRGGRKALAKVNVQGLRFRLYGLRLQACDVMGGKWTLAAGAKPNLNETGADLHDPTFRINQEHRMRLVIVRGRHKLWQLEVIEILYRVFESNELEPKNVSG